MGNYERDYSGNWDIRSDSANESRDDDDGLDITDGRDEADDDRDPYRPEAEHLDKGYKPYGRAS